MTTAMPFPFTDMSSHFPACGLFSQAIYHLSFLPLHEFFQHPPHSFSPAPFSPPPVPASAAHFLSAVFPPPAGLPPIHGSSPCPAPHAWGLPGPPAVPGHGRSPSSPAGSYKRIPWTGRSSPSASGC